MGLCQTKEDKIHPVYTEEQLMNRIFPPTPLPMEQRGLEDIISPVSDTLTQREFLIYHLGRIHGASPSSICIAAYMPRR